MRSGCGVEGVTTALAAALVGSYGDQEQGRPAGSSISDRYASPRSSLFFGLDVGGLPGGTPGQSRFVARREEVSLLILPIAFGRKLTVLPPKLPEDDAPPPQQATPAPGIPLDPDFSPAASLPDPIIQMYAGAHLYATFSRDVLPSFGETNAFSASGVAVGATLWSCFDALIRLRPDRDGREPRVTDLRLNAQIAFQEERFFVSTFFAQGKEQGIWAGLSVSGRF